MQVITAKSGGYRTAETEAGKVFLKRLMPFLTLQKAYCSVHGEYETYSNPKTGEVMDCPFCEKERERQEQLRLEDEIRLNKIDGLPPKYRYAGFKNFEITPQNKAAYNTVLNFAKTPGNKWLLLLGGNGTGKTHLANAALKVIGGCYTEFNDLARNFLGSQNSERELELFKKYAYCPLLVIDEIDKVKATEGRIGWLNSILSKRYNYLLPVILCGNTDLKTLCAHIDLNNGKAMSDRIDEVGEIVIFNWESRRPKIRNAQPLKKAY